MKTEINNELIRSFKPCYNPSEVGIPEDESLSIKEWILKYKDIVKNKKDIIWLICRKDFMSDKDMRLFAVFCARQALKFVENPDIWSINAVDVAERYACGEATLEELKIAHETAKHAYYATNTAFYAYHAVYYATAVNVSVRAVTINGAAKAREEQIQQLLTYFK